jgi:3-methyl-2-oxobutanoate hydroxymethyltransferase
VHQLGGYRMQRDLDRLMADAESAAHAGACAVILECVPQEVAATITRSLGVPTIGIGAGPHCDGQVLVMHDLVGLSGGRVPRFVRAYADVKGSIGDALARWRNDVEQRRFPGPGETLG